MKVSLPSAPEVVILSISNVASNGNLIKMTIFLFQSKNVKIGIFYQLYNMPIMKYTQHPYTDNAKIDAFVSHVSTMLHA